MTTANDGIVRMWDLDKIVSSGGPKELFKAPNIHKSGIFCMDVFPAPSSPNSFDVCTGSKDKQVVVTNVSTDCKVSVKWRGDYHEKGLKCVAFAGRNRTLVGSAADDGGVAVADYRAPGSSPPSTLLEDAHSKPHSISFGDGALPDHVFMTAGSCSDVIKLWDLRSTSAPVCTLRGHTFKAGGGKRNIHHPHFYTPFESSSTYVISGGDKVRGLTLFSICDPESSNVKGGEIRASNRGEFGDDAGACAVEKDSRGYGFRVACSAGEGVHLLSPRFDMDKNSNN